MRQFSVLQILYHLSVTIQTDPWNVSILFTSSRDEHMLLNYLLTLYTASKVDSINGIWTTEEECRYRFPNNLPLTSVTSRNVDFAPSRRAFIFECWFVDPTLPTEEQHDRSVRLRYPDTQQHQDQFLACARYWTAELVSRDLGLCRATFWPRQRHGNEGEGHYMVDSVAQYPPPDVIDISFERTPFSDLTSPMTPSPNTHCLEK